jgi:hypothetical protein
VPAPSTRRALIFGRPVGRVYQGNFRYQPPCRWSAGTSSADRTVHIAPSPITALPLAHAATSRGTSEGWTSSIPNTHAAAAVVDGVLLVVVIERCAPLLQADANNMMATTE